MKHNRLDGEEYFDMLDEFISACYARWYVVMRLVFSQTHTHTHTHTHGRPNVFIQFEDFSSDKASFILDRYKNDRLCFNDDIQGTGAVCVAGT